MKKQTKKKGSVFSNFLHEFKDNIAEGAKIVSSKTHEWFDEAKEKADELYELGAEKYEQASTVVHNYADKYKGKKEIKELSLGKSELYTAFGDCVFHEFKKNGTIAKRFLTTKKTSSIIKQIENIDKQILRIGKELDKLEK